MSHLLQDRNLQNLLNTWEGSRVVDEDGSNIVIYKPKRKSKSTKKAAQDLLDDEEYARHIAAIDNTDDGYPPVPMSSHSHQPMVSHPHQRSLPPAINIRTHEGSTSQPKKKKKKKQMQLLQENHAVSQLSSGPYNNNNFDMSRRDHEEQKIDYHPIAASNNQDVEQPSDHRELIPLKRHYTTYKMPTPHQRREEPNNGSSSNNNGISKLDHTADNNGNNSSGCCSNRMNYRIRSFKKSLFRFKYLKLTQLILATYIAILTFVDMGPPGGLRDTETGLIIDKASPERTAAGLILVNGTERAIVASSLTQVICIGVARLSAWLMYPTLVLVFFSKFRATIAFLSTTPITMYMHSDAHELHVYCGWSILMLALVHSAAHLLRWAEQGNLSLLFFHFSGLTGFLIISSCLMICIPMTLFREHIKYEVRKFFHYFFIVFALALCFHTPTSAIPNGGFTFWVFGILLIWYFLDFMFCQFFMTEKIETTKFSVLPSGVRVTMEVSKRFQKMGSQGGICYICLPWVSKNQWHAFSLFENPKNPAERQIFIQKTGDWTTTVHKMLQRDTVRPSWIHGPFPSPYDDAVEYDNQILVASGIGITPALSVIRAHKESRRINLIWAVRDPHLLGFFLNHLYLDHQGWNLIFYTGREKLKSRLLESFANTNICIIEGRPKLHNVIPNIIFGIESGNGLPEWYNQDTRIVASEMLIDRLQTADRPEDVTFYAQELGFTLPIDAIDGSLRSNITTESTRNTTSECIMENLGIGFRPWENHPGAANYVRNLDKNMVIPTWGMLYCGGAKPVLKDLKQISDEYHLGLHVESFAW